ncbi:Uncharacterised protein [Burkholderia pseudomallei]|nr:Uncharacterised protein [Burkholderia pseudomallei]CAJ4670926.1 Uncharacterised protein [Burkholderia pseudomallei]CAJ6412857.1 Uncharacterised protein [Burkholderia pseudomallei]CAJ6488168.1 Uncharacterised protein [Burkholderia pseudomallei]
MPDQQQAAPPRRAGRDQRRDEERPVGETHAAPRVGEEGVERRIGRAGPRDVAHHQPRRRVGMRRFGEVRAPPRRRIAQTQPQGVVARDERREPRADERRVDARRHIEEPRLVIVIDVRRIDLEKPVVNRQQRHVARARPPRFVRRLLPSHVRREKLDRLMAEDVARRKHDALLARARRRLDRQDRIAADGEEVVGHPERRHAQHGLPDRAQRALRVVARRHRAERGVARRPLDGERFERLAIELAGDALRQRMRERVVGRHHVVRQTLLERADEGIAQARALVPRRRRRGALGGHDVRDEPRVAVRLALEDHGRLADERVRVQRARDLVELDAIAANLDLLIGAAEEFEHPVARPAREVACHVDAPARRERVRQEPLGGQLVAIQVAARDAVAGDIQVARHPDRHRPHPFVEHVDAHVAERAPDRHPAVRDRRGVRVTGGEHGRLGRAVHVVDRGGTQCMPRIVRERARQLLADDEHVPQPVPAREARIGRRLRHELAQQRRREIQVRDAVPKQCLDDQIGRALGLRREDRERAVADEPAEQLRHRHVERVVRLQQIAIVRAHRVARLHHVEQVRHVRVRDGDALRLAGRAGRIEHVGRRVRIDGGRRARRRGARRRGRVEAQRVDVERREPLAANRLDRQQQRRRAVAQHERHAVGRQLRVDRHISAAGLERREDRAHHVERALEADRDAFGLAARSFEQPAGERVDALAERRERHRRGVHAQRDRGGACPHASVEARVDQRRAGALERGRIPGSRDLLPFAVGQARKRPDGRIGHRRDLLEQRLVLREQAVDRAAREQCRRIFDRAREAVVTIGDLEAQVVLGRADVVRHGAHRRRLRRLGVRPLVVKLEHRLEQRGVARVAIRARELDHLAQRQRLVLVRIEHRLRDAREQAAERLVGAHARTQHDRIDEIADGRLERAGVARRHRRADREFVLPAAAPQQDLPCGHQRHEQRRAVPGADGREPLGERGGQHAQRRRADAVAHGRAREIGRQIEHRRHAGQLRAPVFAQPGDPLRRQRVALPARERAGRSRRGTPCDRAARAQRMVRVDDLARHDHPRPRIEDNMMNDDLHHVAVRRPAVQARTQQRPCVQVEARLRESRQCVAQAGFALAGLVRRRQHRLGPVDLGLRRRAHALPQTLRIAPKRRAQRRMPSDHLDERPPHRRVVDGRVEAQRDRQVICGALLLNLRGEPQIFLCGRSRRVVRVLRRERRFRARAGRRGVGHGTRLARRAARALDPGRELAQRRAPEHVDARRMHAAARAHDVDEQRRRQRAADVIDERLVHIGAGRPQMLGQPGAQPQRRLDHVI